MQFVNRCESCDTTSEPYLLERSLQDIASTYNNISGVCQDCLGELDVWPHRLFARINHHEGQGPNRDVQYCAHCDTFDPITMDAGGSDELVCRDCGHGVTYWTRRAVLTYYMRYYGRAWGLYAAAGLGQVELAACLSCSRHIVRTDDRSQETCSCDSRATWFRESTTSALFTLHGRMRYIPAHLWYCAHCGSFTTPGNNNDGGRCLDCSRALRLVPWSDRPAVVSDYATVCPETTALICENTDCGHIPPPPEISTAFDRQATCERCESDYAVWPEYAIDNRLAADSVTAFAHDPSIIFYCAFCDSYDADIQRTSAASPGMHVCITCQRTMLRWHMKALTMLYRLFSDHDYYAVPLLATCEHGHAYVLRDLTMVSCPLDQTAVQESRSTSQRRRDQSLRVYDVPYWGEQLHRYHCENCHTLTEPHFGRQDGRQEAYIQCPNCLSTAKWRSLNTIRHMRAGHLVAGQEPISMLLSQGVVRACHCGECNLTVTDPGIINNQRCPDCGSEIEYWDMQTVLTRQLRERNDQFTDICHNSLGYNYYCPHCDSYRQNGGGRECSMCNSTMRLWSPAAIQELNRYRGEVDDRSVRYFLYVANCAACGIATVSTHTDRHNCPECGDAGEYRTENMDALTEELTLLQRLGCVSCEKYLPGSHVPPGDGPHYCTECGTTLLMLYLFPGEQSQPESADREVVLEQQMTVESLMLQRIRDAYENNDFVFLDTELESNAEEAAKAIGVSDESVYGYGLLMAFLLQRTLRSTEWQKFGYAGVVELRRDSPDITFMNVKAWPAVKDTPSDTCGAVASILTVSPITGLAPYCDAEGMTLDLCMFRYMHGVPSMYVDGDITSNVKFCIELFFTPQFYAGLPMRANGVYLQKGIPPLVPLMQWDTATATGAAKREIDL